MLGSMRTLSLYSSIPNPLYTYTPTIILTTRLLSITNLLATLVVDILQALA